MASFPTADVIAAAIVAAAKCTGENPENFKHHNPDFKCRHYALHAVLHCFQGIKATSVSAMLCCPGKPEYFYRTSLWYTLGQAPHHSGEKKCAAWWRDEHLDVVIRAIQDATKKTAKGPPLQAIDSPEDRRAVMEAKSGSRKPESPVSMRPAAPPAPGKKDMYEMLRQAVINTGGKTNGR